MKSGVTTALGERRRHSIGHEPHAETQSRKTDCGDSTRLSGRGTSPTLASEILFFVPARFLQSSRCRHSFVAPVVGEDSHFRPVRRMRPHSGGNLVHELDHAREQLRAPVVKIQKDRGQTCDHNRALAALDGVGHSVQYQLECTNGAWRSKRVQAPFMLREQE